MESEDETLEEYEELIDNMREEFGRVEYPVMNPMEVAPYLSDGPDTVFQGEEAEFKASKFATKLRKHLSDGPHDGFPYSKSEDLVDDVIYSLSQEEIIQ